MLLEGSSKINKDEGFFHLFFHRAWESWESFSIDLCRILHWLCVSWSLKLGLRLCSCHQGFRYALTLFSFRKLHVDVELMQSWCWYFQKTWRSVVEKAKWLWAAFSEEIFVMWSESASLILFILINLSISVCSRPRMSTTIIERYKSLAFEWNPFVLVGSPSARHVSECVDTWAKGCSREGDAEFVLLLLKPEFVPKLNFWPASVEVISWICRWCMTHVIPYEFSVGCWPYQHPTAVGISCPFRQ